MPSCFAKTDPIWHAASFAAPYIINGEGTVLSSNAIPFTTPYSAWEPAPINFLHPHAFAALSAQAVYAILLYCILKSSLDAPAEPFQARWKKKSASI